MEEVFYQTPTFWVAMSSVAFVIAAGRPIVRFIVAALDKRSAQITADLQAARDLRAEAQKTLEAYQKKQAEALNEAKAIIAGAEHDAKALAEQAEADLRLALDKRMKLSMEKIAQAEAKALSEIQSHVVDVALAAARTLVQEHLTKHGNAELVKQAAVELARKLH